MSSRDPFETPTALDPAETDLICPAKTTRSDRTEIANSR